MREACGGEGQTWPFQATESSCPCLGGWWLLRSLSLNDLGLQSRKGQLSPELNQRRSLGVGVEARGEQPV